MVATLLLHKLKTKVFNIMKIIFEPTENDKHPDHPHNRVEISYPDDDLGLDDMLNYLIIPALYGLTYSGVDEFFEPVDSKE